MKKKSLIILITCTVMIAMFCLITPASAGKPFGVRAVFEADIVPYEDQPLDKGEVWIRELEGDYLFKVEIEGAAEGTYYVYLIFGSPSDPTVIELPDPLITDENGEGKLVGEIDGLCSATGYAGNPWIEIRSESDDVYYVSGFAIGQCTDGPVEGPVEGPVGGPVEPLE